MHWIFIPSQDVDARPCTCSASGVLMVSVCVCVSCAGLSSCDHACKLCVTVMVSVCVCVLFRSVQLWPRPLAVCDSHGQCHVCVSCAGLSSCEHARKLCVTVMVSVCVCVLCRSVQLWPRPLAVCDGDGQCVCVSCAGLSSCDHACKLCVTVMVSVCVCPVQVCPTVTTPVSCVCRWWSVCVCPVQVCPAVTTPVSCVWRWWSVSCVCVLCRSVQLWPRP